MKFLPQVSIYLAVIPAWFKPESSDFGFVVSLYNLDSR